MSQIYPTLKKMESEGLVISLIESSPIGPDRKIYTRTNEGKRVLYTGDEPMEATIFKKPCVVLRDSHERPECQEVGGIILSGYKTDSIINAVKYVTDNEPNWTPPSEYTQTNVSDVVCKIMLSV